MITEGGLVSICIPAYNCGNYIQDTLRCLCYQTYTNIEIIVVNDGSTDNTFIQIEDVLEDRIKVIAVENGGAARARNIAYQNSSGSLILFFDADDLVDQDYLYNQIRTLDRKTDCVVIAQWGRFINNDLSTFQLIPNPTHSMNLQTWVEEFWYHANPMTNPGRILIPKNIIEKAGLWNEDLSLNDDLEFFTRIFDNSNLILFDNESTFYYRSGINGLSCKKGFKPFTSLYRSVKLSTEVVLKSHKDTAVQKACANMWQSILFIIYPHERRLIKLVKGELDTLVKADLKYPAGGVTKILINLLGWRLTTVLKQKLNAE